MLYLFNDFDDGILGTSYLSKVSQGGIEVGAFRNLRALKYL